MKRAFVYVSHRADLHWLSYSLRFLRRNWRDPDTDIVVRIEPDCTDIVKTWAVQDVKYYVIGQWSDGYANQMYQKLTADVYTDADVIMLIDSDIMLLRPCWFEDLLTKDGKIIVEHVPWSSEAEKLWRGPSSAALGFDVDQDYMVRHPFVFWRQTFLEVRSQIEKTVGKPLKEYMYSDQVYNPQNFSNHRFPLADYECLNCYAVKRQPNIYEAVALRERDTPWPFRNYWSHGDWSEELRQEFDRRLSI